MNKRNWIKAGITIVILTLFIIPFIAISKHVAIYQIYSYFVDSIHDLTGLNKYLIQAVVLSMIVPLMIGLKWYFFSPINKKRRYIGLSILIAILISYNFSLYHFTKTSYFAFSKGKVLKWYAETPEGIRFFDAPGYDPKYGIELKQATPEMIVNLERKKRGMQPRRMAYNSIDEIEFFDSLTGENKVWYYIDESGNYELYDSSGIHPVSRKQLKPVTEELVLQIKAKLEEDVRRKQEEALKIEQQRQEEAKRLEEQRKAQEHEDFLKRYLLTRSFINNSESQEVAVLVVDEGNNVSQDITQKIALSVKNERLNVVSSLFTDSFVSDGIFEGIFRGDANEVKKLELSKYIDYVILGKKIVIFSENPELQNVITAKVSIEVHLVSAETGTIEDSFTITETGAGFSKDAAEEILLERIPNVISQKILNTFIRR
ncbi:MAG: hypothetical protein HUU08_12280 [Candidatus Brocadia sp.]|nr:hypothetical protein [Candidatus Brocadia sp.]